MAKKKKITRKELLNKPDEFITFSSKMFKFVSVYQTQILFGFIVFIILIASVVGIKYSSNKAEKQTSDSLGMMMAKYEAIKKQNGPVVAYQAVEKESQQLLARYSNRKGGKLARVLFANICYNAGETDKAIEFYTKSLNHFDDTSAVKYFVLNGLGYCYEEKNDYKTAVKYFQMIVEGNENSMKGEALFNLGRIYAEMGDTEKSLAAFKKVLSDYSDSIYVELIKERLAG
jgi:tetratricopeptide (TPR) repeat protein